MQKIKKITSIILIAALLACVYEIIPIDNKAIKKTETAHAAVSASTSSGGWDVFVDSSGNVVVISNDKMKAPNNIYYKTWGLTFSRGMFNPPMKKLAKGAATEYFEIVIDQSKVEGSPVGGGRVQTTFKYDYETMKGMIAAASGEWRQEIEDAELYGGTAYVRVDCIMYVHYPNGSIKSGPYKNDPTLGPYDDETKDANPKTIQAAEGWAGGSRTGLRTHYHRWLPIHSGKLPEEKTVNFAKNDWLVTNSKGWDYSGDPVYAGGNANFEGYNASMGIPSNKTVTGFAEASPWYGGICVWARMVTKRYKIKYCYKWTPDKLKDKETISGKGCLDKAVKKLEETEDDDRAHDTAKCVKIEDDHQKVGHDTGDQDVNKVYHHYLKVYWSDFYGEKNGSGEVLDESEEGDEDPAVDKDCTPKDPVKDKTHDPKRPTSSKRWLHKFWYYKIPTSGSGPGGSVTQSDIDAAKASAMEASDDREVTVKKMMENLKNAGYIIIIKDGSYEDVVPMKVDLKLTCVVVREFWDDEGGIGNDKYIQTYAAFEYIDPWKTMFYDLDFVELYNDCYSTEQIGFPQTVPTNAVAWKGKFTGGGGQGSALSGDVEGEGQPANQMSFSQWLKDYGNQSSIDASMIATNDYLKWPETEMVKDGLHMKNEKIKYNYKKDIELLEKEMFEKTLTQNDYVLCKNATDLFSKTAALDGPDDGIFLGNLGEKGVIKGCDFRDAYWAIKCGDIKTKEGTKSLADSKISGLYGLGGVHTEKELNGTLKSQYYYLCTNSAACDKSAHDGDGINGDGDANGYYEDNLPKAAGINQVWEKLGWNTVPIYEKINNGEHTTTILVSYSPLIVGPGTVQQFGPDSVVGGHLYTPGQQTSTPHGTTYMADVDGGEKFNFSMWGGAMGSEEPPMISDGENVTREPNPEKDTDYYESVNR